MRAGRGVMMCSRRNVVSDFVSLLSHYGRNSDEDSLEKRSHFLASGVPFPQTTFNYAYKASFLSITDNYYHLAM